MEETDGDSHAWTTMQSREREMAWTERASCLVEAKAVGRRDIAKPTPIDVGPDVWVPLNRRTPSESD